MDALGKSPSPGEKLQRAAKQLEVFSGITSDWTLVVAHAMKVVWSASLAVGIHGLFVEALNEKAHTFYQSLGFIPLVGENENALFFPTKSIELLFTQSD